jgi:hypothetical protein
MCTVRMYNITMGRVLNSVTSPYSTNLLLFTTYNTLQTADTTTHILPHFPAGRVTYMSTLTVQYINSNLPIVEVSCNCRVNVAFST